MKCYKAIEKYYNEKGQLIENLCGYGYCKDLEEAKSQYKLNIIITEITEIELNNLRETQQ